MTDQIDWSAIVASKHLQPHEVDVVIYHHPCSDGTGACWAAWKYLSINQPNRAIQYCPRSIGAPPPRGLEGKNVLICDYSYRYAVLTDLLSQVNKLLVIDHHRSAEKDLQSIDDRHKIFRMDYSGAMLTWYYFFGQSQPPPLMLEYIQDRDIWTKRLPHTDDFAAWFHTLPHDVEVYDQYQDDDAQRVSQRSLVR